jgi:hypothetical protein
VLEDGDGDGLTDGEPLGLTDGAGEDGAGR